MMMTTTMRRMRMMERAVGGAKSERRSLLLVSLAMAVVLFGTLVLSAEEDDGGSTAKLLGDPGYGRPGPYPISRVLKRNFSVPNATTGCRQGSTDLCPQTVNLFFPTVAKLSRSPDRSHCGDLNRVAGEGVGESAFRGLSLLCDDGEREEREEREDGEGGEVLGEAAAAAAAAAGAGAGACADAGAAAAIAAAAATSGFPLAIFSPGFMLSADLYFGYGEILASWGYVVVVWEPNTESVLNYLTHRNRALVAIALIDWAFNQSQNVTSSPIYQKIDPSKGVFAAGHSAGGKTSALAAQFDKAQRILGVVGVDPVDCSPPFQSVGPSFPSSLPNLAQSKALKAWIGSEFGQSCAPAECNYQKFYTADRVPSWQVLILKSGHMSFCNGTVGLPGLACKKGTVSVKVAIELSSTVLVALAEASIRNADIKQFMKDWCTSQSLQVTCLSK